MLLIFYLPSENPYDVEFEHLLKGKEIVVHADDVSLSGLTSEQKVALLRLSKLNAFKETRKYIAGNSSEFNAWLVSVNATQNVPQCWSASEPLSKSFALLKYQY